MQKKCDCKSYPEFAVQTVDASSIFVSQGSMGRRVIGKGIGDEEMVEFPSICQPRID